MCPVSFEGATPSAVAHPLRQGYHEYITVTDWFLFNQDGAPLGPWPTEVLANRIVSGEVARDSLVAMDAWFENPGTSGWKRADEIEEIAQAVVSLTRARFPSSRADAHHKVRAAMKADKTPKPPVLRVVDGAHRYDHRGTPDFAATIMMVGGSKPSSDDHGGQNGS